jgi:RNAse (barnase) inhibitor barstar
MKSATIDLTTVTGWESFHELFAQSFDFPAYYGRNMDAWIDCMEDLAIEGSGLRLDLKGMKPLKARCPEIYDAINECSAFIRADSSSTPARWLPAL